MDKWRLKNYSMLLCVADWIVRAALIGLLVLHAYRMRQPDTLFCVLAVLLILETAGSILILVRVLQPVHEMERAVEIIEKGSISSNTDFIFHQDQQKRKTSTDRLIGYIRQILKSNYDSQILKSQAEIHALQSQINPHFLYNTLETIRSQAVIQGSESIEEMTEALAVLFRYSISQPGEMASLREELENIDNYLLIQQYRFPDKFRLEKHIEDERLLECKVPVLTLQPLIENAIHHGLEMKIGKGTVRIRVIGTQDRLLILITDDGMGMTPDRLDEIRRALEAEDDQFYLEQMGRQRHSGIALINVNRRIRFYFGRSYGLHLYSTQNVGTTIELSLPNPLTMHQEEKLHD